MRLEEIKAASAAEQRVRRMKANAKTVKDRGQATEGASRHERGAPGHTDGPAASRAPAKVDSYDANQALQLSWTAFERAKRRLRGRRTVHEIHGFS